MATLTTRIDQFLAHHAGCRFRPPETDSRGRVAWRGSRDEATACDCGLLAAVEEMIGAISQAIEVDLRSPLGRIVSPRVPVAIDHGGASDDIDPGIPPDVTRLPDDSTRVALTIDRAHYCVRFNFGRRLAWFAMTPDQAVALSTLLIEAAVALRNGLGEDAVPR